jgi:hypothetical protein
MPQPPQWSGDDSVLAHSWPPSADAQHACPGSQATPQAPHCSVVVKSKPSSVEPSQSSSSPSHASAPAGRTCPSQLASPSAGRTMHPETQLPLPSVPSGPS